MLPIIIIITDGNRFMSFINFFPNEETTDSAKRLLG